MHEFENAGVVAPGQVAGEPAIVVDLVAVLRVVAPRLRCVGHAAIVRGRGWLVVYSWLSRGPS